MTLGKDIAAVQEARLLAQVRRCYERIPFYRDRWDPEVANIGSREDFDRLIPFIAKQDLLGGLDYLQQNRVARPGSRPAAIHLTSGTSGLGQELHPVTAYDAEALSASWVHRLTWAGLEPGDGIAFTFPVGLQTGGLVGQRVADRMGLAAYFLGPYGTERKVEYLLRFRPAALVISPSYLTRVTSAIREAGKDPREVGLKALLISGESYTVAWAQEMMDAWRVKLYEWYSCMQAGTAAAYSCERGILDGDSRGCLHFGERRVLLEVLEPESSTPVAPGEEGEAVITSLFREAFPVIRFRTGDKIRLLDRCECGREERVMEAGTVSRFDDMLKIRGQNLWPAAVDQIVLGRHDVEEYQARVFVDDRDQETVELKFEFAPGIDLEAEEEAMIAAEISREIREKLNVRMALRAVPYMTLPRYEFKVRRWTDERSTRDLGVERYQEKSG